MTSPQSSPAEPTLTFSTPTAVAVLGGGRVGGNLATALAGQGHRLLIGERDPDAAAERWTGPAVTFTDPGRAAQGAQIVINATPGEFALEFLSALRAELAGKVLVDVANATYRGEHSPIGGLVYPGSSLAEQLQAALPDTQVVKTLNTMMFKVMTDPRALSTPPTAFLSGNDASAKATVRALLGQLGWPAEWTLDLGDIRTARGVEELFLFVPYLARTLGFVPFALSLAR